MPGLPALAFTPELVPALPALQPNANSTHVDNHRLVCVRIVNTPELTLAPSDCDTSQARALFGAQSDTPKIVSQRNQHALPISPKGDCNFLADAVGAFVSRMRYQFQLPTRSAARHWPARGLGVIE
jgi:hypothetical protein